MAEFNTFRKVVEKQVPDVTKPYLNKLYQPLKRALFRYRYGNRDTLTIRDGSLSVEFDTSQSAAKDWFFPGMADGSLHEPVVTRALLNCLDSDSVFFDIGANVGYFSVVAAEMCSEVHAFEMDSQLTPIIESNFKRNGVNGEVINKAVSNESEVELSFSPHQSGNPSTNKLSNNAQNGEVVSTLALTDYVKQSGVAPNVVKIDVEGAEGAVLSGGDQVLWSNVEHIFLELHPIHMETLGYSLEDISDFLSKHEYSCGVFGSRRNDNAPSDGLSQVDIAEIPDTETNTMYFCSQRDDLFKPLG